MAPDAKKVIRDFILAVILLAIVYRLQPEQKTGDEIPKININLPDPSKPSDIFWVKAAQHTLPVGFAKSVEKVECFNDMIEILYVGEESEEMVLPCKISFTKDRFIFPKSKDYS